MVYTFALLACLGSPHMTLQLKDESCPFALFMVGRCSRISECGVQDVPSILSKSAESVRLARGGTEVVLDLASNHKSNFSIHVVSQAYTPYRQVKVRSNTSRLVSVHV
jgi:hypothetical protein